MRRLLIAAALLMTAESKPAHDRPTKDMHVLSADSTAMDKECGAITVTRVVRVVIPRRFDPANVQRNVKYKNPTANDDDDANNDNGTPNAAKPPEPFDIDLRPMSGGGDQYAMIRVILRDTRYSFYTWTDLNGDTVDGVGNGEVGNPFHFCGPKIKTVKPDGTAMKWPVAVFFVRINPKSGLPDAAHSYNIGIVSMQNPGTPVFIDPNVKNNG